MKKYLLVIATMALCTLGANGQYLFDANGIGPVLVGGDIRDIPEQYPDLYDRVEFVVHCGSEDGEGVSLDFYLGNNHVITADLEMAYNLAELISSSDLGCQNYKFENNSLYSWLLKNNATTFEFVSVTADANAKIKIGTKEYPVTTPVRTFAQLPGATASVMYGEGLWVDVEIGKLYINANFALSDAAARRLEAKLISRMNRGIYNPVKVRPIDFAPKSRAYLFSYKK